MDTVQREEERPSQEGVYAELQAELAGPGEPLPNGVCVRHDRLTSVESTEPGVGV